VMLKVILYAYFRGIIRSRDIATACQENVTFMVLSGDDIPHFTTIATFVRELKDEIANLFTQVLFLCDAQSLIGREMFAIDGVNTEQRQKWHPLNSGAKPTSLPST
jgi:transposase